LNNNYVYSLERHVSTHTSHLQTGTIFVYNVTVLILGSQTLTCLGSQNEHSDIVNKYSSSLKMTRVSRNMSL